MNVSIGDLLAGCFIGAFIGFFCGALGFRFGQRNDGFVDDSLSVMTPFYHEWPGPPSTTDGDKQIDSIYDHTPLSRRDIEMAYEESISNGIPETPARFQRKFLWGYTKAYDALEIITERLRLEREA